MDRPFSDKRTKYGDIRDLILCINKCEYEYCIWGTDYELFIDLNGRHNHNAWTGRCKPSNACALRIEVRNEGIWPRTAEDIASVSAVIYDHYHGTYWYECGRELKDTNDIPLIVD